MTDYEIDIRAIDPEYSHTIARQAGREVDDGLEVHLSRLTVRTRLSWPTSRDHQSQAFDVVFGVDHDSETVRPTSIGDAHSKLQSVGIELLVTALEYAERAAIAFLEDVGPDYRLRSTAELLEAAGAPGDDVVVHTALEADADA
jgi:trimethylamine:corrinoid methyltransferase-like protein